MVDEDTKARSFIFTPLAAVHARRAPLFDVGVRALTFSVHSVTLPHAALEMTFELVAVAIPKKLHTALVFRLVAELWFFVLKPE